MDVISDWNNSLVYYAVLAVGCLALSRLFFDSYYFLRCAWCILLCRLKLCIWPGAKLLDEGFISVRCLTTDLDHMIHMNNARYSRECDFGRFSLLANNGLFRVLYHSKMSMGLAATTIRFRRSINFLETATLRSKIVYWDDRSMYIEQTFLRPSDSFVYATLYAKYTIVNGTVAELFDLYGYKEDSPTPSPDLLSWICYNKLSSERLRPKSS